MPILWRHLIFDFLRTASVCMMAFIAILLTMRFDEIAHFAALGAPVDYLVFFIIHQIPYILPIALPLSCLIAALLLVQRMSHTQTLTTLRSSGLSFSNIFMPLWLTAAFLTVGNFWITSEVATRSHLHNHLLKSELRAINPLLLLHNKHLMRVKGFHFEALGPSHVGESSSEVVLALPNPHHQRIHLLVAQNLHANPTLFTGQEMTLITGMGSEEEENFDQLLVENMRNSLLQVSDLTHILKKKFETIHNDHLQLPLLLARIQEQGQSIAEASAKGANKKELKILTEKQNRNFSEIMKRFSIALSVFSCTFMGTALGINISRKYNYKSVALAIGLTTLYLIAFFVAKGVDHKLGLAAILYFAPHLLMIGSSLYVLNRMTQGCE